MTSSYLDQQVPLDSGFGATSTTDEIISGIDLSGRVAIVTGGYSGLGRETVRTLLAAGARVIVPARDRQRAEAALSGVAGAEIAAVDLLDPASIDEFANAFLSDHEDLHLLVNSAAIMANPLTRDRRGYESQFATNHLGHFQLTARLWPALRTAGGARVVNVSSIGHRYSPVNFADPHFLRRPYVPHQGYGQAKTANILFTVALDRRGREHGVRSFALHPGNIPRTNLGKYLAREDLIAAGVLDADGNPVVDPARQLKTVEQGAATIVWCAVSPQLDGLGGLYCENCDVATLMPEAPPDGGGFEGGMRLRGVRPYAIDPDSADRLWQLSEQLVDVTFDPSR